MKRLALSIMVCGAILMGAGEAGALGRLYPVHAIPRAVWYKLTVADVIINEREPESVFGFVFLFKDINVSYGAKNKEVTTFIVDSSQLNWPCLFASVKDMMDHLPWRNINNWSFVLLGKSEILFSRGKYITICPVDNVKGRRLPKVLNFNYGNRDFTGSWPTNVYSVNGDIGTELLLGNGSGDSKRPFSSPVGHVTKTKSGKEPQRPYSGKSDLPPREIFLPFSGVSATRSGISRPSLFYEVIGLTLVGVVFAALGALGVLRIVNNPNWQGKLLGAVLLCGGLFGTALFYGWAAFLHPLYLFGLSG